MDRRKAIQTSAFLAGCGLSASTLASLLSGCKSSPSQVNTSFLGEENLTLLGELVETIIPTTDTPGAKEAGVHTLIDEFLKGNFVASDQKAFVDGLQKIKDLCQSKYSKDYTSLTEDERHQTLDAIADEGGEKNIFNTLKSLTCYGFFSSEIGATQVLKFDPIPGEWRGCIDYSEIGVAWAL